MRFPDIRESLDLVGSQKAVGYLPLRTITNVLRVTIDDLSSRYAKKGLSVRVYGPSQTCIQSGALFVYDKRSVSSVCANFSSLLTELNWPSDPDQVIAKLAARWFEADHPAIPMIRKLFGENDDGDIAARDQN